ncbi:MAG: glycosyltransferase family 2 protein [Acidimicrobiales bacterium]
MAHSYPSVTAVMPARNDAKGLVRAVESVLNQAYPGDLRLIIAVAPSDDESEAVAKELAHDERIDVTPNPGGGTAAGLNAALELVDSPVVARVDAHCVLPPGYIHKAIATLGRTGAANVGGVQRATGSGRFQEAVAKAMTSRFGVGNAKFHYGGDQGPTDTVYLGVFDSDALKRVGGFDETLTRNQDYELNWRLREAGYTIWFDPELEVAYSPRGTVGTLAKQYFEYGQWKREVLKRHPRSLKARQLAAPVTVLAIAAGAAGAARGHRLGLLAPLTYAAAVLAASTIEADEPSEAATLATVFPTMHLCWGAGFLVGPKPRNVHNERQHL